MRPKPFYFLAAISTAAIILGAGCSSSSANTTNPQSNTQQNAATSSQPATNTAPSASADSSNTSASYTAAEVVKHNSPSDCWFIIHGEVYNVTGFQDHHPGGQQAINASCGKDATANFEQRPDGSSHSSRARNLLATFLIGTLKP